jgi:hypothetical protein
MITEYRAWLTVRAPSTRSLADWEDLLTQLTKSPVSRGPVMSCGAPYVVAEFTVSYPAADSDAASRDSVGYVTQALTALSWPACTVTVDQIEEVDVEKELQDHYIPPE